jgi:hypothetical protein
MYKTILLIFVGCALLLPQILKPSITFFYEHLLSNKSIDYAFNMGPQRRYLN